MSFLGVFLHVKCKNNSRISFINQNKFEKLLDSTTPQQLSHVGWTHWKNLTPVHCPSLCWCQENFEKNQLYVQKITRLVVQFPRSKSEQTSINCDRREVHMFRNVLSKAVCHARHCVAFLQLEGQAVFVLLYALIFGKKQYSIIHWWPHRTLLNWIFYNIAAGLWVELLLCLLLKYGLSRTGLCDDDWQRYGVIYCC